MANPPRAPRVPHPIEVESYRRLRALVDLTHLDRRERAVTERVIHASAEVAYARDLVMNEADLEHGHAALENGALVITDTRMTKAGISGGRAVALADLCADASSLSGPLASPRATSTNAWAPPNEEEALPAASRTAAWVRTAVARGARGAVWIFAGAPTALEELLRVADEAQPAFIIGLPVGFVGAVEAKEALRASGLASISNRSVRGGAAVAAAACNALLFLDPSTVSAPNVR